MTRADNPELRLFQAVVCQAIIDAVTPLPSVPSIESLLPEANGMYRTALARRNKHVRSRREAAINQADARVWLLSDSPDFNFICECAELDPEAILNVAERLEQGGWPVISGSIDPQEIVLSLAA